MVDCSVGWHNEGRRWGKQKVGQARAREHTGGAGKQKRGQRQDIQCQDTEKDSNRDSDDGRPRSQLLGFCFPPSSSAFRSCKLMPFPTSALNFISD